MATGFVKCFSNPKGLGFNSPYSGQEHVFVHFSTIEMVGFGTPKRTRQGEFDIMNGEKGLNAVNIRLRKTN